MAGTSTHPVVICCFCGKYLAEHVAVRLVLLLPNASGESQTLYCHSQCLVDRLSTQVPIHPDLEEDFC